MTAELEHAPMLQAIGLYRVLTVTAALGIISEISSDSEAVASESNLQRSQKSSRGKGKGSSSTRELMIVAAAPYACPLSPMFAATFSGRKVARVRSCLSA